MQPIRNIKLDRQRFKQYLDISASIKIRFNQQCRNNVQFKVGDFVLMYRDKKMHQQKFKYEFEGPFEIVSIIPENIVK